MSVVPGEFVRHPGQPGWGTGRVVALVPPDKVRVRFVGAGEKLLQLAITPLEGAKPSTSEQKFLEGPGPRSWKAPIVVKPHEALVARFLQIFPKGFRDRDYRANEREYKVKAHELAVDELSERRLRAAMKAGKFDVIAKSALRVLSATNLVYPNEKMALTDALGKPGVRDEFSRGLADLLYGKASFQSRFEAFSDVLLKGDAAKWTLATYFPYIVHPQEHMFLKPAVTQKAAEAYGYWLAYDPHLNWRTYDQLLGFAKMLSQRLAPLKPVDMLDIQSFLWVAGTEE